MPTFPKQIFHYDLTLRFLIASRDFMLMHKLNKDIYIEYIYTYIYYMYIYLTSQSQAAKFCNCLAGWPADWQLSSLPDATRLRGISENVKHKLTNCWKGKEGRGEGRGEGERDSWLVKQPSVKTAPDKALHLGRRATISGCSCMPQPDAVATKT